MVSLVYSRISVQGLQLIAKLWPEEIETSKAFTFNAQIRFYDWGNDVDARWLRIFVVRQSELLEQWVARTEENIDTEFVPLLINVHSSDNKYEIFEQQSWEFLLEHGIDSWSGYSFLNMTLLT